MISNSHRQLLHIMPLTENFTIGLKFGQPEPSNSCCAADHPITLSAFQEDSLLIEWSHGTVLSAAMMAALKRVEQDNNCIGCPNN